MLNPQMGLWLIEMERRRERDLVARERMARERLAYGRVARQGRARAAPLHTRIRRSAGRRLVRIGLWLVRPEAAAPRAEYAVERR